METQRRQLKNVLSSILPARLCNTRAQHKAWAVAVARGGQRHGPTLKGVKQGCIQLDRGHGGQVAVVENS